jgi:hypothetical protein
LRRNKPNHAGRDNAAFAEKIARDAVIYCHTPPLRPAFCGAQRIADPGAVAALQLSEKARMAVARRPTPAL